MTEREETEREDDSRDDAQWSTLDEDRAQAKRPRKRIPTWLWGCGIGCGLMLVIGVLGMILMVRAMRTMVDPDVQWAALEEYLEVAERPAGYQLTGNPGFMKLALRSQGYEAGWNLVAEDQSNTVAITVLAASTAGADVYELAFDAAVDKQPDVLQTLGFHGAEAGVLAVQGRDLRVVRYASREPAEPETEAPREAGETWQTTISEGEEDSGLFSEIRTGIEGAFTYSAVRVDLTPEPGKGPYVLMEYRANGRLDRVPDAVVAEFLEAFDLSEGPR